MSNNHGILVQLIKTGRIGIIYPGKMVDKKFVISSLKDDMTPDLDEQGKRIKVLASAEFIKVIGYVD